MRRISRRYAQAKNNQGELGKNSLEEAMCEIYQRSTHGNADNGTCLFVINGQSSVKKKLCEGWKKGLLTMSRKTLKLLD